MVIVNLAVVISRARRILVLSTGRATYLSVDYDNSARNRARGAGCKRLLYKTAKKKLIDRRGRNNSWDTCFCYALTIARLALGVPFFILCVWSGGVFSFGRNPGVPEASTSPVRLPCLMRFALLSEVRDGSGWGLFAQLALFALYLVKLRGLWERYNTIRCGTIRYDTMRTTR